MDINSPIVARVRGFLTGAKISFLEPKEITDGVVRVQYENSEVYFFYDQGIWECTHPRKRIRSAPFPRLQNLGLGMFPYRRKGKGPLLKEYPVKFLRKKCTISEMIEKRRQAAADEGNFE